MAGVLLLAAITVLYAGYNLLIKVAGGHVPVEATTTILATIALQVAALTTSTLFLGILVLRGGHAFSLSSSAYFWAAAAGLCIGAAEICYLYLFGGIGGAKPMDASIAIPVIVSGTIVIALLFSFVFLREQISGMQVLGCGLILAGMVLLFLPQQDSI